jgi:ketosteroid isomerase-like protein
MKGLIVAVLMVLAVPVLAGQAEHSDVEELTALLNEFLANAGEAAAHERFWAEDLVYTSSRGSRTSKAEIMAGFDSASAAEDVAPTYSAQDVDIRLYGDMAVVAFRLVATPPQAAEGEETLEFFNTGTFIRRDGAWRAIAWQATAIPRP